MLTAKFIADVLAGVPADIPVVFEHSDVAIVVSANASYGIDEIRIHEDFITLKSVN